MTYDTDHRRCDLSKNIDCKNGERPNWIPPSERMEIVYIDHHPINS
jgi:nanoRNase/pAp phosphatase (c-di-AMP/oligoRNAs hydrolase)